MLPPAHGARWKAEQPLEVERYWRLSYSKKVRRSEAELLEELDSILRGAVQRRLVSDVPLGAFLSGGVDSSLIVSMMTSLGAGPVEAVHVGFDDPPQLAKGAASEEEALNHYRRVRDEIRAFVETLPASLEDAGPAPGGERAAR